MAKFFPNFCGCLAILIWSLCPLAGYHLKHLPIYEVVAISFLFSGLASTTYLLYKKKLTTLKLPRSFYLFGACFLLINHMSYLNSFHYIPPEIVELGYYSWPILLTLLTCLIKRQKFSLYHLLSSLIGFVGLSLLILPSSDTFPLNLESGLGIFFCFLSAFSWCAFLFHTMQYPNNPPTVVGLLNGLAGCVALVVHLTTETFVMPTLIELASVGFIGLISMSAALFLWDYGIKKGQYLFLSNLAYSIPLISLLLLHHKIGISNPTFIYASGLLLVTAAYLSYRSPKSATA